MPYCEACNRFWNPPAMGPNGECPECRQVIADPPRAPWHFKVLMVGVVLYLGFRGYQGVVWVIHHL